MHKIYIYIYACKLNRNLFEGVVIYDLSLGPFHPEISQPSRACNYFRAG